jgi:CarD family transcriptional regulator
MALQKEFQKGDMAVYPAHGVGEIKGIENREISGYRKKFYIMRILESDMTVMIPTENVKKAGLREIIPSRKVKEVWEILKDRDVEVETQTWNRRYREYIEKIKTGSIFEIAEVLRDLSLLSFNKELSFGERKMLETARKLLSKEIAIAMGMEEPKINERIDKIFHA